MEKKDLNFPGYFPKDCPPQDAKTEELVVFRYIENDDKVTSNDFLSYYQLGLGGHPINKYGLSVLTNIDECVKGFDLPGIKGRYKSLASGCTFAYTGVVKKTASRFRSHHTWWLYEGVEPHRYFVINK